MTALPAADRPDVPAWRRRWDELNQQRYFRRTAPATLRAAWWALRAVRHARAALRHEGVGARVASPPPVPWGARTGVYGVLSRLDPTCIERCLVQQAWLHAFGVDREVVVGVRIGAEDFRAHAWIADMVAPDEAAGYTVIHRLPPGG